MKLSSKIFFSFVAVAGLITVGELVAVRAAWAGRQKVDFQPGFVEQPVKAFKIVVMESRLAPNSELTIKKSDRFAIGSDENFWKSATVNQSGDTLFIRQFADKRGKMDDPGNDELNDYATITLLCPEGVAAIRTDISLTLRDLQADSLTIIQVQNAFRNPSSNQNAEIDLKKCDFRSLFVQLEGDNKLTLKKENMIGRLTIVLRDSSDADIIAPISESIRIDCGRNSHVSMDGVNLQKVIKN